MVKDAKAKESDWAVASPFTPNNLALIAKVNHKTMVPEPTTVDTTKLANGCYMTLALNGEKVVNASTSFAGVAYFGTNRPTPTGALKCTADLGEAYAYRFPLFCNAPRAPNCSQGECRPRRRGYRSHQREGCGRDVQGREVQLRVRQRRARISVPAGRTQAAGAPDAQTSVLVHRQFESLIQAGTRSPWHWGSGGGRVGR